ncbi:hypothetical protein B0H12DRAFT_1172440 [Mycena haematopus]|nr:hypothetical protein B0H12DRAFT_1172440 [Mycena haematopus]
MSNEESGAGAIVLGLWSALIASSTQSNSLDTVVLETSAVVERVCGGTNTGDERVISASARPLSPGSCDARSCKIMPLRPSHLQYPSNALLGRGRTLAELTGRVPVRAPARSAVRSGSLWLLGSVRAVGRKNMREKEPSRAVVKLAM